MSWWDYGYQITAMANRTILVDNNTWNNTHISRVGQAMASTEDKAYAIMRELDVDYVLVIFGGLTGYASDGKCISSIFLCDGQCMSKISLNIFSSRFRNIPEVSGQDTRSCAHVRAHMTHAQHQVRARTRAHYP